MPDRRGHVGVRRPRRLRLPVAVDRLARLEQVQRVQEQRGHAPAQHARQGRPPVGRHLAVPPVQLGHGGSSPTPS